MTFVMIKACGTGNVNEIDRWGRRKNKESIKRLVRKDTRSHLVILYPLEEYLLQIPRYMVIQFLLENFPCHYLIRGPILLVDNSYDSDFFVYLSTGERVVCP